MNLTATRRDILRQCGHPDLLAQLQVVKMVMSTERKLDFARRSDPGEA